MRLASCVASLIVAAALWSCAAWGDAANPTVFGYPAGSGGGGGGTPAPSNIDFDDWTDACPSNSLPLGAWCEDAEGYDTATRNALLETTGANCWGGTGKCLRWNHSNTGGSDTAADVYHNFPSVTPSGVGLPLDGDTMAVSFKIFWQSDFDCSNSSDKHMRAYFGDGTEAFISAIKNDCVDLELIDHTGGSGTGDEDYALLSVDFEDHRGKWIDVEYTFDTAGGGKSDTVSTRWRDTTDGSVIVEGSITEAEINTMTGMIIRGNFSNTLAGDKPDPNYQFFDDLCVSDDLTAFDSGGDCYESF